MSEEKLTRRQTLARLERSFGDAGRAFTRSDTGKEASIDLDAIADLETSSLIAKLMGFVETLEPDEAKQFNVLMAPAVNVAREIAGKARTPQEQQASRLLKDLDMRIERGQVRVAGAEDTAAIPVTVTVTTTVTVAASRPIIGC